MKVFKCYELPSQVILKGEFDETCEVSFSQESLKALELGKLKLRIHKHGGRKAKISSLNISIESISGNISIFVGNDNSSVSLGLNTIGAYDLRLWRTSKIVIGKYTTSNGVRIVCNNSEFICGEDCMFSDNILIQSADQHGIVDLEAGAIINNNYKSVVLGNHVWLGRNSTITANASIGEGAVIGTAATVTSKIPAKVIAVGVPARVIKENHTWCRSPVSLDLFAKQYIDEIC
ncbi:MAG: acyltransferase [Gammaproteobacteria bacterium]|nr:acyltransferase [Gammaproteobacteria bacterium]